VWPRPPLFRCQRDQAGLLDPARAAGAEFRAELDVAPSDPLPVVRFDPKERQRSLDVMRWGLIPSWAKDMKDAGTQCVAGALRVASFGPRASNIRRLHARAT
jgi:putative SOS response-associated peptidase YedK